jgi:hypothetical protein
MFIQRVIVEEKRRALHLSSTCVFKTTFPAGASQGLKVIATVDDRCMGLGVDPVPNLHIN